MCTVTYQLASLAYVMNLWQKQMVFSSSATVYGEPKKIPCVEDSELMAVSPYGRTKVSMAVSRHECYVFWVTFGAVLIG